MGRGDELVKIHEKFHQQKAVAISAVAGMGGVGKTELAVKYTKEHIDDYPGGICWLNARDTNLAVEIIQFVQLQMGLEVIQQDFQGNALTLNQQIAWCWQNWQPSEGLVLVVFDDVTNLEGFSEILPTNNRFRVLITTRLRNLDTNIEEIPLDVLSADEALQLLINLVGEKKVDKELVTAKELCKWLGYLPLGIELIGRYIVKKPFHWTLTKMLEQLKQQRLYQEAINPQRKTLSTAQRGVLAAFELSWVELNQQTQQVAILLSLFAPDIFLWEWVESMAQFLNWDASDVEIAIEQLYQRHLVQSLEEGVIFYKIHPLIREFLQSKLTVSTKLNELKQAFLSTFIEIAQSIPDSATLELINSVKKAIPHLTEVAENLTDAISDKNLICAFVGLARFYKEQGLYTLAEPWFDRCVSVVKSRLGEEHADYATSLSNLGFLYSLQGKYKQAEPLSLQALELRKRILGEEHADYATSLNNLGFLYYSQGKYEQAEPLYIKALELRKRILGEEHADYATSLNNLAELYRWQGKYEQAEPLYIQAKELRGRILGENNPDYAQSFFNLALLYYLQGKYEQTEPLFIQALDLTKSIFGENHPNYAISLKHLASLYDSQGKYEQAEPLYIKASELIEGIFGENHPLYLSSLNSLAVLYQSQGKYEQSQALLIRVLELCKRVLGESHPYFVSILNNLGSLYNSQEKYEQAEPLLVQALKLRKCIVGEDHPDYANSLNNLGFLYNLQGKYEQAEPFLLQALELRKRILGEEHADYATSLNNLATLYRSQGRYDEAGHLYIQALEISDRILGSNHPTTKTIRENLEKLHTQQQEGGGNS
ncbi:tetratricopeptide repeat protein [Nostoc calcicola FACHB-389]|nr:tetratricopeptide repeat protein [Nostoc calcicola FACHB-389]